MVHFSLSRVIVEDNDVSGGSSVGSAGTSSNILETNRYNDKFAASFFSKQPEAFLLIDLTDIVEGFQVKSITQEMITSRSFVIGIRSHPNLSSDDHSGRTAPTTLKWAFTNGVTLQWDSKDPETAQKEARIEWQLAESRNQLSRNDLRRKLEEEGFQVVPGELDEEIKQSEGKGTCVSM